MLKTLQIKNIALIDEAIIDFENGLNVLSGETGSGKSVIIDSINFALGAKADKTMIRNGQKECCVIAVFDISGLGEIKNILSESDADDDGDELIITRKLSQDSKSSVRVNGVPFTLTMLKSVTALLVDVHGQSDHYSLLKSSEQLSLLDKFAGEGLKQLKTKCAVVCEKLRENNDKRLSFGGSESDRAIKADILKFQIEEIESADLKEGEEDELLIQKKKFQNAEKLSEAFLSVQNALSGENGAIDGVNLAVRALSNISNIDEKYSSLCERLKSVSEELYDVSSTAEDFTSEIEFDNEKADEIENRLDLIKSLKRKYGISEHAILDFAENAKNEYEKLVNYDAEYIKLTKEKKLLLKDLKVIYTDLSNERKSAAIKLAAKIKSELCDLGMKNADFEIAFSDIKMPDEPPFSSNGGDAVEFRFSANLGEPLKPMSKIISGGEMSRFMLALKAVTSSYHDISTYIFDEIDVGISGETAEVVAEKFAKIAQNIQVIAISHLPQIVSFADCSFKISKHTKNGKTFSKIGKSDNKNKIKEIVRLIGGDMTSESAVKHAEEIVERANAYKNSLRH